MIDLDPQLVATIAVAAAAVALVALVVVIVLATKLRSLRKDVHHAFDVPSGEDIIAVLGRHDGELAAVRRDLATVHTNSEHLRDLLRTTVSRVGVLRYDAFDDMGGALSFSAALLDERGDGMVISAINGRTETRCYAKAILDGKSEHSLSREEEAAVEAAIEGRQQAVPPPGTRRRRRAGA
jgi:hypothetical protein